MKKTFLIALLSIVVVSTIVSCEDRNIRQVVKDIAEAPVDTTGMLQKTILTNSFSAIYIDCFSDVTFHQTQLSDTPRVVLRAIPEVLEQMNVKVDNGSLDLTINRRYRMPEKAVAVVDIFSPFVSRVTVNGAKCFRLGKATLTSPIDLQLEGVGALTADSVIAPEINIGINGAGSVHLQGISTTKLRCQQKGNSTLILEGNSQSVEIKHETTCFVDTTKLVKGLPL